GPGDRWGGNADVHFHRAGLAQHPYDRPLGVAPHDRVVDHDQPLAAYVLLQRVELEPDAELAQALGRLDESTPDVGVLDQAGAVRDARLLGEPDRGRDAGLRYPDHQVGGGRVLARQPPADLHPGGVHVAAGQRAVRAGQVDVLEQAALRV